MDRVFQFTKLCTRLRDGLYKLHGRTPVSGMHSLSPAHAHSRSLPRLPPSLPYNWTDKVEQQNEYFNFVTRMSKYFSGSLYPEASNARVTNSLGMSWVILSHSY